MKKEFLEGGRIVNAHGVRGLVKVDPWCDSPAVLASMKRVFLESATGFSERRVITASSGGGTVIMNIEGIDTREGAIAMKNRVIFLHRDDIPVPEGAMLLQDMIGLPVIHAISGKTLGTLSRIDDAARGQIYTVATEKGDVLIPAVDEFIKEIDESRGISVLPIPGMFYEENEV